MITKEEAQGFAREWIEAWNSHNLDDLLEHYTEDFEMTSPFITSIMNEPSGTLKGKDKVRTYWSRALARIPDLRFEMLDVFIGVNSIIIYCRAVFGKLATEVMFFDDSCKVVKSVAHYNEP